MIAPRVRWHCVVETILRPDLRIVYSRRIRVKNSKERNVVGADVVHIVELLRPKCAAVELVAPGHNAAIRLHSRKSSPSRENGRDIGCQLRLGEVGDVTSGVGISPCIYIA